MDFWGWICDALALSPEEEARHHELMVEYGIEEPTPDEYRQMEWEDTLNYIDHMPYEKDVWYDGQFTGYYQFYRVDQKGHRHYDPEIYSFYSGYTGPIVQDLVPVVIGEVVEEHIPVYMRLQGDRY